ncbi:MAG: S1 RNA-binding domain-containing protein [bacterium]
MNTTPKLDSAMTKLLDEKQYFNLPKVGDLVKGTIIAAEKNEIHIDLSGMATGIVRGRECYGESEEYKNLQPGDEVEATVLDVENENGEMELSLRYAGRQKAWQIIRDYQQSGKILPVLITDANKGGLMIKVENIAGFLPVSQLSPEHYPRVPGGDKNRILEILKSYVGKKFEGKILDIDEKDEKLIVSEKTAWEETQHDVISQHKVGDVIEGTVTAITDFGVFVEFGKLEGLIHISEIAWQRIDDPNDFVKVGQKIKAEIIGIENSKIFLSMKKLATDPWHGIEKKYKIGDKAKGTVIKANPFGLFVEIAKDIQGLAHISQLSSKPNTNIEEIAKAGDVLDFYIVSMDPKNHRLGLSLMKPKEGKVVEKAEAKSEVITETKSEETSADEAEPKKRGRKKKEETAEAETTVEEKTEEVKEEPKTETAE